MFRNNAVEAPPKFFANQNSVRSFTAAGDVPEQESLLRNEWLLNSTFDEPEEAERGGVRSPSSGTMMVRERAQRLEYAVREGRSANQIRISTKNLHHEQTALASGRNQAQSLWDQSLMQSEGSDSQGCHGPAIGKFKTVAKPKGIIEGFVNTCQRWQLEEHRQLVLLGYQPGSHWPGRHLLSGLAYTWSRDEESRIRHVMLISLGLEILFGRNIEAENAWLRLPRPELDFTAPLDYMLEGDVTHLAAITAIVRRERGL